MPNQIPIWIINLERSKERRKYMEKLMNKYNLKHEFIEAVDASKFSKEDLKKCLSTWRSFFTVGRPLAVEELACALSHLKCWKKMQKEDIEKVVILEDDVFFNEKFVEFLHHADRFPRDWEKIHLGNPVGKMHPPNQRLFDIYTFIKFCGPYTGCFAYILNSKGTQKLIDHYRFPVITPIDHYTGNDIRTGTISYGLDPQIVVVDLRFNTTIPSRSDLGILESLWLSFFGYTISFIKYKYKARRIRKKTIRELEALQPKA